MGQRAGARAESGSLATAWKDLDNHSR